YTASNDDIVSTPMHILPIYEDLSRSDVLEMCLGGHTQNANESFNSTVGRLAPKHLHSGSKIIEIAAYIATGIFNFNTLNLQIGPECKFYAENQDAQRMTRQERRTKSSSKEARRARRQHQIEQQSFYMKADDLLCGPGIAD
ncbi:hypothetical protein WN55_05772, partial [Dufourea novaeangliae]